MHKKLILIVIICVLSFNISLVLAQNEIKVGETLDGDASQVEWELFLEAGQLVKIGLTSGNDPILSLYNADGDLLAENDDINFPLNTNSQIIFSAEETGRYTLNVKDFGSDTPKGAYSLSVVEMETRERVVQGELPYGVTQVVSPNGAATIEFNFEGNEGDVINLSAISEFEEDTSLSLFDSEGNIIATADDNRAGKNPFILRLKLPQSDIYRLDVTGVNGQYLFSAIQVSLTHSEELLLNDGAQTVSLGYTVKQDVIVLNTEVSQQYLIKIALPKETASTLFVDIHNADGTFAGQRISSSGLEELFFVLTAEETGQTQFILSFFSFDETDMEFTVSAEVINSD